jgi:hypothetical protein
MKNRSPAAADVDNSVAENLSDEDFIFEGEDGQLVGAGDDFGSDGEPSEKEIAEGTEGETQETQEGAEDDGSDGEEPAGSQPGSQPAAKPAGTPDPAAETPPAPQATASDAEQYQPVPTFHETVSKNWSAAVDHVVAQKAFALSPEEAEIIDPAAAPVIERKCAEVYLRAVTTFSKMLHDTLPTVVGSLIGINQSGQKQEETFMQTYGFKPEEKQMVTQVARFVRVNNPGLQGKAYADEVARMSYSYLGKTPPKQPTGQNPAAKSGVPAKPGAKVVQRKSFTPAAQSGGGGTPQNRRAPGQPAKKPDAITDLNSMLSANLDFDD